MVVATGVAGVSLATLLGPDGPGARPVDAVEVILLILLAAPLTLRRKWPVFTVIVVGVIALAALAAGYPGGPPTIALLVALYGVAANGHRRWSAAVTVVFAGGGLVFRALVERESFVSVALHSALFVLVSLLGDAVHSRRLLASETRERLRLAEAERNAETQRRIADERLRIARELHDVMAHSVTTVSVQAGAALDALDSHPGEAREMLRSMRATSRHAMQELRATVSLLRADPQDGNARDPAPGLEEIDGLVARIRHAGIDVDMSVVGRSRSLPPAVELTAYRIVQEALTNVIRHASATAARVLLTYAEHHLVVQIDDDGSGPSPADTPGFGLRGLQERVDALAGTLFLGTSPSGGFRLRAQIPTQETGPWQ